MLEKNPWEMTREEFAQYVSTKADGAVKWSAGIYSRDGETEYTLPLPEGQPFDVGGVSYCWWIAQGHKKRGSSMSFSNPTLFVFVEGVKLSSHTLANECGSETRAARAALNAIRKDQISRHNKAVG